MQGKRIIQSLQLINFLSFSDTPQEIELQPLNVLIGPNASGKSNFIEALRVLSSTPEDIGKPIREGGGIREYIWKASIASAASLKTIVSWDESPDPLHYSFWIEDAQNYAAVGEELIYSAPSDTDEPTQYFYRKLFKNDHGELTSVQPFHSPDSTPEYVQNNVSVNRHRSILSQFKDPNSYPALSHLQEIFSEIYFYTGWNLGRYGSLRNPQRTDLPSSTLLEDGSNLGLVLINKSASVRQQIAERLKAVLPTVEEIFPKVEGGSVSLYLREKGFSTPIPASRLSEGTLRYLCLLTLLLDPTPPPIICLEEPEAGLHPHVVSQIAELLIDASQRTQLIVTTHSDALISGLSECPEAIITCERDDEGTKLRRLDPEQIKPWLDRYALGDLWRMGEIGGVR